MNKITLSGIDIHITFQKFSLWKGKEISNTYGGKAVLQYNNKPLFAELVALEMFIEKGYEGVWVDTFRNKYRTGLPETTEPIELPVKIVHLLNEIKNVVGKSSGVWDLLLWKDDKLKFVELKRKENDKIRNSQIDFLKACLSCGYSAEQFEILEWDIME